MQIPSSKSSSLSVIVPVFNEAPTLRSVVDRLLTLSDVTEIIIVDDGSTDGSTGLSRMLANHPRVNALFHSENLGKGAAIRTAIAAAAGKIIVVQDADLEYDPAQLPTIIAPIKDGRADVVFGTRFASGSNANGTYHSRLGNLLLTWLANRTTGLKLTDMETCYKAMRRSVVEIMVLRENRFGIEPELTAKIARGGWRVLEIPIRYSGRSYAAGKKLRLRDGFRAVWCLLRYAVAD